MTAPAPALARLELRPWKEDDAAALSRAITESLEHLRPWMPWAAEEPRNLAERRAWIRETNAEPSERIFGAWSDGVVVGACGLHDRGQEAGLEIGYWVHVDHVGRGIATEMARRLTALAFEDPAIELVEIRHDPVNLASRRVPEKLGFTLLDGLDDRGHRVWRLRRP